MKKHYLLMLLVFALAIFGVAAAQASGGSHGGDSDSDSDSDSCRRIQICHFPPANPDNFHTIRIRANKWSRHERHGDLLGSCQGSCEAICDDADPCTQDVDPDTHQCICLPTPVPVSCDDGVSCTADSCDPVNGNCVSTNTCDDANPCTADVCSSGECTFPPVSGCIFPPVADGEPCDDLDPDTIGDMCISGTCTGEPDPCAGVTCEPLDECHVTGICTDGVCDDPIAVDGTPCTGGTCVDGTCEIDLCLDVTCLPLDECHVAGTCTDGVCDDPPAADGTPCTGGTCGSGVCVPDVDPNPECDVCVDSCVGLPLDSQWQSCETCEGYVECGFAGTLVQKSCPTGGDGNPLVWDDGSKTCETTSSTCSNPPGDTCP
ncbi:MAG: hypothetical protein GY722_12655 [bacterium]|nr:hypothetical protein [bacterium]